LKGEIFPALVNLIPEEKEKTALSKVQRSVKYMTNNKWGEHVIVERMRPGFPGMHTIITDEDGTEFDLVQITRGPSKGVFAAVEIGPGSWSTGWTCLSPKEPLLKFERLDKTITLPNGKTKKISSTKRVKNIDWEKATFKAIERARNNGVGNPTLPKWAERQRINFAKRCAVYYKH